MARAFCHEDFKVEFKARHGGVKTLSANMANEFKFLTRSMYGDNISWGWKKLLAEERKFTESLRKANHYELHMFLKV